MGFAAFLGIAASTACSISHAEPPARFVAVTFDDLPVTSAVLSNVDQEQLTERLVASIEAHGVPPWDSSMKGSSGARAHLTSAG